jgi:transposase-like protein
MSPSPLLCPRCGSSDTAKAGHNHSGTQRYQCAACRRYFTPQPKEQGHGVALHEQAVRLYLEGMSQRAIGRILGVVHQSVANWVAAAAARLPTQVADRESTETIEVDELETFVGGEGTDDRRDGRRGA